jgi:hypothetical protein
MNDSLGRATKRARTAAGATIVCLLAAGAAFAQAPKDAGKKAAKPPTVTLVSLLEELGDLKACAFAPAPPFSTRRFSSYDRRSTDPSVATDEGWFANDDTGHFLRVDEGASGKEYVMAECDGPGAVVRIWSADPKGKLKVYVDGAAPLVAADFEAFLSGKTEFAPTPIAGVRSRGYTSHLPIPFQKRIKVTTTEPKLYYHVDVRTYATGTPLISATPKRTKRESDAVAAAARRLEKATSNKSGSMNPEGPREQQSTDVGKKGQSGMVTWLAVFFADKAADAAEAEARGRGVVMRWSFDGVESVDVPLDDFFCATGGGVAPYGSAATGLSDDGVRFSRWPMPWSRSASVEFWNFGEKPVKLGVQIFVEPLPPDRDPWIFHAQWRQARDLRTKPRTDWRILEAKGGTGQFVGCALTVFNPIKAWWGEGDEKFYVDGETFPSTFGTGVEDYFGYAWCDPTPFVHALHGQPRCEGPGNYGRTSLYRWHTTDRVPFTKSFTFDLETWHSADCAVTQAATVFWYGAAETNDVRKKLGFDDLELPTLPSLAIKRVQGALEGEALKVLSKTGETSTQDLATFKENAWSGDAHLWWRGAKPADVLSIAIEAPKAAKFRVFVACTKGPDYGVHAFAVGGAAAGGPRDFYSATVEPSGELDLGVFELKLGENPLDVRCLSKSDAAKPGFMFGLDYVRLVETP